MSAARMRTVAVIFIPLVTMSIARLTAAQPATTQWTEVDHANDVWQRDLEDGSHEFIALPHTPYVVTNAPGSGAAWGGRTEDDGTLSNWFTVQWSRSNRT